MFTFPNGLMVKLFQRLKHANDVTVFVMQRLYDDPSKVSLSKEGPALRKIENQIWRLISFVPPIKVTGKVLDYLDSVAKKTSKESH